MKALLLAALVIAPMPGTAPPPPGGFAAGWAYVHEKECTALGLITVERLTEPDLSKDDVAAGFAAAYVDVFDAMAQQGVAEGLKEWCINPWFYFPERGE